MIISASRRTDIPAFYGEWLSNRLREGYALVRNPMRFHQVSKVLLVPDAVDFIVFWSKNPAPLLSWQKELEPYDYGFHFTLTGYGPKIEPGVPEVETLIRTFRTWAARIGPERMVWRYDPILLHPDWPIAAHRAQFLRLAEALAGSTHRCVISFLDLYPSGGTRLREAGISTVPEQWVAELAPFLVETAGRFGMTVEACAEPQDLTPYGIRPSHCIDSSLTGILSTGRDRSQRPNCGCQPSVDIGAYHSCTHRCAYCYANHGEARLDANLRSHDAKSPMLLGRLLPDDTVRERV